MKKTTLDVNMIFCVNGEMIQENGEDSFLFGKDKNRFVVCAFDGLGGSGSKKYEIYSGKTGAYVASRAVCGGVMNWFLEGGENEKFMSFVKDSLSVCKEYSSDNRRLVSSLAKDFPTTAAIISGTVKGSGVDITCYWAGDSRCYMLDADGLHQLTEDDLDGQDAMSNLTADGIMTNVINISVPYVMHNKTITINRPCLLFSATDGCFGYLKSPMNFENLITDAIMRAKTPAQWKKMLDEDIKEVTGDDYTLSMAACGFGSFEEIKKYFKKRNRLVFEKYIEPEKDANQLWQDYKKEYSRYI